MHSLQRGVYVCLENYTTLIIIDQVKLCVELDSIEWRNDFEGSEVIDDGLNNLYQPMTIDDKFKSSNWT